ncbi:MAG: PAS domain-containing sensor histidine kinase [Planctomycetota bacterium]
MESNEERVKIDAAERLALISAENCDLMAECHRLTRENERHQALLRNASEAVVVLTPDGVIESFNRAAETVFGRWEHEVRGKPLSNLIPCPLHDGNAAQFIREYCAVDETKGIQEPLRGVRADGREVYLRAGFGEVLSNTELWDDGPERNPMSEVVLCMFRDVTAEVELEQRLREKGDLLERTNRDLMEANLAKDEFLANMSHELRTPLHGILSFARFGLKKGQTADREKLLNYFQTIETSGRSLLTLVNDLLDLAKLESGKMTFELRTVDVAQCLDQTIGECTTLFRDKKLTCNWANPGGNLRVLADGTRIQQVILNLLSNAIRYSPDGGNISIQVEPSETKVTVTILDEGPGIPEDELETVFEKFVQSSQTNSGAGGTGLGLPICREIVNAHSGRIWAESCAAGGKVSFSIPTQEHFQSVMRGESTFDFG